MFTPKQFNIPDIDGISKKTVEEHLKLYEGYVKNANLIQEKLTEYRQNPETHSYAISELNRRFAFEFNGMRNHEYYFDQLEGGPRQMSMESSLAKKIEEQWGSAEKWLEEFKLLCLTRGIGWAVLWYDPLTDQLINSWIDEQHLGHLNGLTFIYGIDMWEHSYLMDYTPAEKKKYVESYIMATNQEVCAARFNKTK
jgi:Fe-Mn family superoxide dismutase